MSNDYTLECLPRVLCTHSVGQLSKAVTPEARGAQVVSCSVVLCSCRHSVSFKCPVVVVCSNPFESYAACDILLSQNTHGMYHNIYLPLSDSCMSVFGMKEAITEECGPTN